jgi:hypothetical protein
MPSISFAAPGAASCPGRGGAGCADTTWHLPENVQKVFASFYKKKRFCSFL